MRREFLYQIILIAIIAGVAFFIFTATQANLAQLGVHSGFEFLFKRAGFEIGQTLIPFDADSTIARAFLVALLNTLVLAFTAIILATVLGLIIAVARLSRNWLASRLAVAYVETFRNIPSLLQIFFWYFVVLRSLPRPAESFSFAHLIFLDNHGLFMPAPILDGLSQAMLLSFLIAVLVALVVRRWAGQRFYRTGKRFPAITSGILLVFLSQIAVLLVYGADWEIPASSRFGYEGGWVVMPEFIALVIGLSMYNATYISEIFRSGFGSIAHGQTEAAQSLGMSRLLTLRLIIFPQALRVIIPPLTTQYLNLFKSTSLAAAIAYPEIVSVFVGTVNNLVGQPVIIMSVTLFTYLLVSICIALALNWYHRKIELSAS